MLVFSLIAAYELLIRQVRRAAEAGVSARSRRSRGSAGHPAAAVASDPATSDGSGDRAAAAHRGSALREVRLYAWRWAQDNRAEDGSLPPGKEIARSTVGMSGGGDWSSARAWLVSWVRDSDLNARC